MDIKIEEHLSFIKMKRREAEQRRADAEKEIAFWNLQIVEITSQITKRKKKEIITPPKRRRSEAAIIVQATLNLLNNHDTGMETKDLHHAVCVNLSKDVPYTTFRSYLSRMKGNELEQKKKRWRIKKPAQ